MKIKVQIKDQTFEVEVGDLQARPITAVVDGETFEVWPAADAAPAAAAPQPVKAAAPAVVPPAPAPTAASEQSRPATPRPPAGATASIAPPESSFSCVPSEKHPWIGYL